MILGGSLFKVVQLRPGRRGRGGTPGGSPDLSGYDEPAHRRLLNIVEEIAIASGTPVPPVYLLAKEPGINAFAAGYSPSDAVVAVTQGGLDD